MLMRNPLTLSWNGLEHNSAVCRIYHSLCSECLWSLDNMIILPRTYATVPYFVHRSTNAAAESLNARDRLRLSFRSVEGILSRYIQETHSSLQWAVYWLGRGLWYSFKRRILIVLSEVSVCVILPQKEAHFTVLHGTSRDNRTRSHCF